MISIIIPVYNIAAQLPRCLDSLLAQTYPNLELIAVNDGSKDESGLILDRYAQDTPRLRVIHKKNGGVSSARNTGLAAAKGDYIGFCDGDDYAEPELYSRLLHNLKKHDADISHCGVAVEGLDGQLRYFHNSGELLLQNREEALAALLKADKFEPTCCTKLFKKELFAGLQFDESITFNEDLLMNFRLFQNSKKSVYEDICLYRYIRREGSACKEAVADKHVFHPVEVRKKIINLSQKENEEIQLLAKIRYLQANISTYAFLQEKRSKNHWQYRQTFRQNLIKEKSFISKLPHSTRLHALLIIYLPFLHKPISKIYYRFAKKNVYG